VPRAIEPEPQVAVVVATHSRAHLLPRLVAALEAQETAPAFEVVVVDDASTDNTWESLSGLAGGSAIPVRPLRLEANRGPATARNLGWRSTSAALIAFTDDDCAPEADWLHGLTEGLRSADVVQGRTIPDPTELAQMGPFSRSMSVTAEDGFYQTCNIAYRRETLERADGFDETFRFPAGEDTDLAWRARAAGATTCFRADAVVRHAVRSSSWTAAARDSWRWQSIALAVKRNPSLRDLIYSRRVWRRSHLLVALTVLGAGVAAVVTALAPPVAAVVGWAGAVALFAPYVHHRTVVDPLPRIGLRRRWLLLPATFAVDGCEVIACLVGSARHRTFVL
jgi:GT2 family glycosyltransferase